MNEAWTEGVWIDGAVPRTPIERAWRLYDLADLLDAMPDQDQERRTLKGRLEKDWLRDDEAILEVENDLIQLIDSMLPDGTCLRVGDPDPGDVIIGPVEDD